MKPLLLALFCIPLSAQIQVSFSPGVKLTRSVYRWSARVCNDGAEAVSFDANRLYMTAERAGIQTLSLDESTRLATKARLKDPLVLTMGGLEGGSTLSAWLIASGRIAAKPNVIADLILFGSVIIPLKTIVSPILPPDYAKALIQGQIVMLPGACMNGDIFARKMKNAANVQAVMQLPASARVSK